MKLSIQGRAPSAAFAVAALVMLVPANVLPVITMTTPAQSRTDTIFSSIVGLFENGLWPLGVIVFAASLAVPFLKIWGIGWLLAATRRRRPRQSPASSDDFAGQDRARLLRVYAILDFIGKWSMLDVFLVAFLTGVVQFGAVASVHPGSAIFPFGAAVVLTMLATQAFDPRTIWQNEPVN